jgi:3-hydroxybutyryl-CoA dehydrogenase
MERSTINAVAILGAGTMGSQIGYLCATHGYAVSFIDHSATSLERARAAHDREVSRDFADGTARAAVLARMAYVSDLRAGVARSDLVIEALPEQLELKRVAFRQLDEICPPQVILASNSSSLRMSRIETGVRHLGRVCNMHFYQRPAPVAELMRGSQTSPETLQAAGQFVTTLGLIPIVLRTESTGFIHNRIWRAIKKECLRIVAEGVATAEEVDRVWMLLLDAPRGPFGLMDQVGLDVVRDIELVYHEESGDESDQPPAFLRDMVSAGLLGVKTRQGFYTYPKPAYEDAAWLGAGTGGQEQASAGRRITPSWFHGAWRLVAFESSGKHGPTTFPLGEEASGLLVYTRSGHMSVLLSRIDRPRLASEDVTAGTADEWSEAAQSFFSYSGTFEVRGDRVIHRVAQSSFPNWVGTEQERFFEFEGDRLILRTPPMRIGDDDVVSRLVWERT